MTNEELVAEYQKGNEVAFNELLEQIPVAIASLPEKSAPPACAIMLHDVSGLAVEIADGTSLKTIAAVIKALKC